MVQLFTCAPGSNLDLNNPVNRLLVHAGSYPRHPLYPLVKEILEHGPHPPGGARNLGP